MAGNKYLNKQSSNSNSESRSEEKDLSAIFPDKPDQKFLSGGFDFDQADPLAKCGGDVPYNYTVLFSTHDKVEKRKAMGYIVHPDQTDVPSDLVKMAIHNDILDAIKNNRVKRGQAELREEEEAKGFVPVD